ncbi:MAG: hypothetical protein KGZ73_05170 [Rhizobiales bacterium]|nr:hypothetical protein [Hyphomicrobiales bacterium]
MKPGTIVLICVTLALFAVTVHHLYLFFRDASKYGELFGGKRTPSSQRGEKREWSDGMRYAHLGFTMLGLGAAIYKVTDWAMWWLPASWRYSAEGSNGIAAFIALAGTILVVQQMAVIGSKLVDTELENKKLWRAYEAQNELLKKHNIQRD